MPAHWLIRPTTGLVREAVFNRLGLIIENARFLDVFAGSGLMGIEACSRGAARVWSVEKARRQVNAIQEQANEWKLPLTAVCSEAIRFLTKADLPEGQPFDVVFLDPPYDWKGWDTLWPLLARWVHAKSYIIAEHRQPAVYPEADCRIYGDTRITWLETATNNHFNQV